MKSRVGGPSTDLLSLLVSLRSGEKITSQACAQIMKGIESALRSGDNAQSLICDFFSILVPSENPTQIRDVFVRSSSSQFRKIHAYLRVYALRGLMPNKSVQVPIAELRSVVGAKDLGRLAVIDFIITRTQPNDEQIHLLEELLDALEDKTVVARNTKRRLAIDRLQDALDQDVDLTAINTSAKFTANFEKMKRCSPDTIRAWVENLNLRADHKRFSVQLVNLGLHFFRNDVSVVLLSRAIELENHQMPSKFIFNKVWRLLLAIPHFPDANYSAIFSGLELCLKFLKVGPKSEIVEESDLCQFGEIASALLKSEISLSVFSGILNARKSLVYTPLISRLIFQFISHLPEIDQLDKKNSLSKHVDRLIDISRFKNLSPHNSLKLHWAYCSISNRVYDRAYLLELLKVADDEAKIRIWMMLAKNDSLSDSYKWCQKIADVDNIPAEAIALFKELYFLDLIDDSHLIFDKAIDSIERIHERKSELIRRGANAAILMDFLLRAWQLLKYEGCHADALKYLSTAFTLSNDTWGMSCLRTLVCHEILLRYSKSLDIDIAELQIPQISEKVSPDLEPSFNVCLSILGPKYSLTEFDELFSNFRYSVKTTYPSLTCLLSIPSVSFFEDDVRKKSAEILGLAQKIDTSKIPYDQRLQFARNKSWLRMLASDFEDIDGVEHIRGRPILASRALHSGSNYSVDWKKPLDLPPNTICLCLDFEDESTLTIRRYEPGSERPIAASLEVSAPFKGVLASINENISGSILKSESFKGDPASFWKDQYRRDHDFGLMCANVEKSFLGEFLGLLSPTLVYPLCDDIRRIFETFQFPFEPFLVFLLRFAFHHSSPVTPHGSLFCPLLNRLIPNHSQEFVAVLKDAFNKTPLHEEECRVVLICDRRSSAVPWESMPIFSNTVVTRALSLIHLKELINSKSRQASNDTTTYLVNPEKNLPETYLNTLRSFKSRGWTGWCNEQPTEAELISRIQAGSSYVFVGHGSGERCLRGSALRRMFLSSSNVYLLGCSSVAIKRPLIDNDVLTDYVVKGSRIVMGNLWAVKDKDFNRFTADFLSRVFDKKQPVGEALKESRSICTLPFLTGASPVVYGLD